VKSGNPSKKGLFYRGLTGKGAGVSKARERRIKKLVWGVGPTKAKGGPGGETIGRRKTRGGLAGIENKMPKTDLSVGGESAKSQLQPGVHF